MIINSIVRKTYFQYGRFLGGAATTGLGGGGGGIVKRVVKRIVLSLLEGSGFFSDMLLNVYGEEFEHQIFLANISRDSRSSSSA
jgi:hypothetical protein